MLLVQTVQNRLIYNIKTGFWLGMPPPFWVGAARTYVEDAQSALTARVGGIKQGTYRIERNNRECTWAIGLYRNIYDASFLSGTEQTGENV